MINIVSNHLGYFEEMNYEGKSGPNHLEGCGNIVGENVMVVWNSREQIGIVNSGQIQDIFWRCS